MELDITILFFLSRCTIQPFNFFDCRTVDALKEKTWLTWLWSGFLLGFPSLSVQLLTISPLCIIASAFMKLFTSKPFILAIYFPNARLTNKLYTFLVRWPKLATKSYILPVQIPWHAEGTAFTLPLTWCGEIFSDSAIWSSRIQFRKDFFVIFSLVLSWF